MDRYSVAAAGLLDAVVAVVVVAGLRAAVLVVAREYHMNRSVSESVGSDVDRGDRSEQTSGEGDEIAGVFVGMRASEQNLDEQWTALIRALRHWLD